jgi:hypothetical protein
MANHLIIYGHGAGDPGAVGNGANERDFNRKKLHPYMKKWADKSKDSFVFFDTTGNRDMFQETANGWGMYSISPSYYTTISEYHEDAAGSSATGGHVIVSSSFKADNIDLDMANLIKRTVGLWGGVSKTNGISYRSNLLNLNVAAQRGLNYRLTEIGFITSSRDMTIINKELDQLAKGFIESITGEKFTNENQTPAGAKMGLWYRGHVSNIGWQKFVGTEATAGTTGKALKLEAVEVLWNKKADSIRSSYRILNGKWVNVPKGITGTTGKSPAIDQICFASNGNLLKTGRRIQYRVHSADVGWGAWKEEGGVAGTEGKQIEAIQIRMLKDGKVEKG